MLNFNLNQIKLSARLYTWKYSVNQILATCIFFYVVTSPKWVSPREHQRLIYISIELCVPRGERTHHALNESEKFIHRFTITKPLEISCYHTHVLIMLCKSLFHIFYSNTKRLQHIIRKIPFWHRSLIYQLVIYS